ncbi:hypothetical protein Tco_0062925 [Tanacetum coccineum]
MNKRKKHFAKLRAEEIRRKPPTKAQNRNQIRRKGKDFSKAVTPLFATMLIQPQADMDEGLGQPFEP